MPTALNDLLKARVGGTNDHVHLLVGLRATHALATFVQDIKQTSSRWIHETIGVKNFAWQPGYGAFTVSVSNCDAVKEYIAHQVEHHRTKTFQEEYVAFLQKHRVEATGRQIMKRVRFEAEKGWQAGAGGP